MFHVYHLFERRPATQQLLEFHANSFFTVPRSLHPCMPVCHTEPACHTTCLWLADLHVMPLARLYYNAPIHNLVDLLHYLCGSLICTSSLNPDVDHTPRRHTPTFSPPSHCTHPPLPSRSQTRKNVGSVKGQTGAPTFQEKSGTGIQKEEVKLHKLAGGRLPPGHAAIGIRSHSAPGWRGAGRPPWGSAKDRGVKLALGRY